MALSTPFPHMPLCPSPRVELYPWPALPNGERFLLPSYPPCPPPQYGGGMYLCRPLPFLLPPNTAYSYGPIPSQQNPSYPHVAR